MALTNATAAFIGASVTLFLVIVFMILMVILVRQCLAFMAKRNALRAQAEHQLQARRQLERQRRGSITEPVPATFDWHHSIRIAGTPPPSYQEAKGLPTFEDSTSPTKKKKGKRERGGRDRTDGHEVIVTKNRSASLEPGGRGGEIDNSVGQRRFTTPNSLSRDTTGEAELHQNGGHLVIELENERNTRLMTSEPERGGGEEEVEVAVDIEEGGIDVVEVNTSGVSEQTT